jgi:glycosyltransferase involved in cell wall biosynthesis
VKVLLCKGRFAGPISGADETLVAYATQMHAAGLDVSVALLYPSSSRDSHRQRLRSVGVRVDCIAEKSVAGRAMQYLKNRVPHLPVGPRRLLQKAAHGVSMRYMHLCQRYFERSGADIVHAMTPDPAVIAMIHAAHAAGIPVLYQELGTADFLPGLGVYYERLAPVLPLCEEIAALSPRLARRFSEKFAPCSVLPLMVEDVSPLASVVGSRVGVTFGFAARMEYGKGPLSLIGAFAEVCGRMATVSLRIAGAGRQHAEAVALARTFGLDGRCSFVATYSGSTEKSAFMHSIDVFVLPSLAEGTPNGIIEAMAHGLPVIASEVGGIPDIVSPEMAILVEPGDVRGLAEAMIELATNPARRAAMGRAARARYERFHSPAAVLPQLTGVYDRVISSFAGSSRHSSRAALR